MKTMQPQEADAHVCLLLTAASRTLLPLCLVAGILLPGRAIADVRKGEMFGYQIGAIYPATKNTRFEINDNYRYIVAERPVKPPQIGTVRILATPKTLEIAAVTGKTSFRSRYQAYQFLNGMATLLGSKYGLKWRDNGLNNGVEASVNFRYRLSIFVTTGYTGYTVNVALSPIGMRRLDAQARREIGSEVRKPVTQQLLQGL
ncbi:MAG TPA: hypothetical protein VIS99_08385 [Terrimicrobiaceae bacterium]